MKSSSMRAERSMRSADLKSRASASAHESLRFLVDGDAN